MIKVWYRIAVINDFNNSRAVINFFKSNEYESLQAFYVSGPKEKSKLTDNITISLNFNIINSFKTKSDAVQLLNKLIEDCPKEAKKDYNQYKDLLYKNLI